MRYLPKGYSLELNNANYSICDVIGEGANSVVYLAIKDSDNSKHIIKEYNPCNVLIERKENGKFIISDRDYEKFSTGMDVFCNGANKQINIRNYSEKIMNYITNVNQIVRNINNTAYIDMTIFNGESYDKLNQEETISDLLKRIKAITSAVSAFHEAGYLYLDLKPSNIFILENVFDLVLLFDFDSVTKKENVKNMPIMSCSANWAAPEQLDPGKWGIISEKSDIFSIGEILFFKLFGRHSKITERRIFSEYDFGNVGLLNEVNPRIKPVLCQLLRKTLSTNPLRRYENCKGLLCDLEIAIKYADISRPYLVSSKESLPKYNVERETDLCTVFEKMSNHNVVILRGMGGIGKSILAKQYLQKCRNVNGCGVFVYGARDWIDAVNNYLVKYIHGAGELGLLDETINPEKRFDDIVSKLRDISEKGDVFVLDNIDSSWFEHDKRQYREKLFSIEANFILTTRDNLYAYDEIVVDSMALHELESLFLSWSGIPAVDEYIERIIKYVGFHTLTVELIAKQIKQEGLTAQEKYEYLIQKGLPNLGGRVVQNKDEQVRREFIIDHLLDLFNFQGMSEKEKLILASGAVLPVDGVPRRLFNFFVDNKEGDIVENIIDKGWMMCDDSIISMHPLLAEVVRFNLLMSQELVLRDIFKRATKCVDYYIKPNILDNWEIRKFQKQILLYLFEYNYRLDNVLGFATGWGYKSLLHTDLKDILINNIYLNNKYEELDADLKAKCDCFMLEVYRNEKNYDQAEEYRNNALLYINQVTNGHYYLMIAYDEFAYNGIKSNYDEKTCWEFCEKLDYYVKKYVEPLPEDNITRRCYIWAIDGIFDEIVLLSLFYDIQMVVEKINDISPRIHNTWKPENISNTKKRYEKMVANSNNNITEEELKRRIEFYYGNEHSYIESHIDLAEYYIHHNNTRPLYDLLKRIDDLVDYLYTDKESEKKIQVYKLWGEYYSMIGQTEQSDIYFGKADSLFKKIKESETGKEN